MKVFNEGSAVLANPNGLTADCRCRYNPRLALSFNDLLVLLEDAYKNKFGDLPSADDLHYLNNIAASWHEQEIYDIENIRLYRGSADLGFRTISG